jgi:hypothetical protein
MGYGIDWRAEIDRLAMVHQRVMDADSEGLWSVGLPRVGASPAQIADAEAAVQAEFDPAYKAVLQLADGWPGIFQNITLFGTREFLGSDEFHQARRALHEIEPQVWNRIGIDPSDLLVIAASSTDLDLFVVSRRPADREANGVLWLAGARSIWWAAAREHSEAAA